MKKQAGFTLIELMIVVAIIGILVSVAAPAFQRYTIRAQIAEGLNLSGPLQAAVIEYNNINGGFPTDNDDAAILPPGAYTGSYVDSISIADDVVSIIYGNSAHGRINGEVLTLTAVATNGSVSWDCASMAIPDRYLPASCQ